MAGPFTWQTLDGWYDEGAARYLAHFRQQLADGQLDRAGCSLRKAAHKARQAKALRELLYGRASPIRGYLWDHTPDIQMPFYSDGLKS